MGMIKRVGELLGGNRAREQRQIAELTDLMIRASQFSPMIHPEELIRRLGEVDPQYLDFAIRTLMNYQPVNADETEAVRVRVILEARQMYTNDVLTGHIIDLWTDFGFGLEINVTPRDEQAAEVWQEFWTATRNHPVLNSRNIHGHSANLLNDGELFFAFFVSTLDGMTTVRTIRSDQIVRRVSHPDDESITLFWVREYTPKGGSASRTIYYADWTATENDLKLVELPDGAVRADELRPETRVVILPALFKERSGRGWPLMSAAFPWSRIYRDFLQDRAAVARAVASIVDKVKVKGGQRAVDALRRQLESTLASMDSGADTNPAPVAGSRFVGNEGVDIERMSLSTGAVDADKDGASMIAQAGLGGRLFPHWLGRGEAFRLATATSMEVPVLRAFQRYQNFWASIWGDMVKIVLTMAEEYGRGRSFDTYEADINTDAILQSDLQIVNSVIASISKLFTDGLITLPVAGSASDQLLRVALGTLGVKNLDEVIGTPRNFDDPSFEEPESMEDEFSDPFADPDEFAPPDDEFAAEVYLSEALGIEDYKTSVNALVRGYWGGNFDRFQFVDGMVGAINRYMTVGWLAGLREEGIGIDEMSEKERAALDALISDQFQYVMDFADAIEAGSRRNGGKLETVLNRSQLWTNRYNEARNTALTMAKTDPKLKWVSEKQNCSTCKGLHGKVKRASYWEAMGIKPQSPPNAMLECEGWNCGCHFETVPEEPLSRGYLPGVRNRK